MKTLRVITTILMLAVLLIVTSASATTASAASLAVTLLDPLPTTIPLGGSYTVNILVESDEPFAFTAVQALPDFPAYVHDHGGDRAAHDTVAELHLTLVGNRATAELPGGVTPIEIRVGAIYPGGERAAESYSFTVAVEE